jgi:uncharacterized protein with NAD-binding domain and iron-sulfur cluster
MTSRPDAIVVGAGFAGVAAATALAERGARVLVLETRQRPGGRAVSWNDPRTGEVRDNGQHVLGSFYQETLRLLERLGTVDALDRDPTFRLRVWERSRGEYELRCPSLPSPWHWAAAVASCPGWSFSARASALSLPGRVRALAGRARSLAKARHNGDGSGRAAEDARAMGEDPHRDLTVQRWLELGRGGGDAVALLWALAMASLNDIPGEASALLFARVLDQLFSVPAERSGLALPRRGLADLIAGFERFIEERGGAVRYRETVLGVRVDAGRAVGVSLLGGARIDADALILAVPHERAGWILRPECLGERAPVVTLPWSPIVSTTHHFDRPILTSRFVAMLGTRTQWAFDRGKSAASGHWAVGTVRSAAFHDVDRPAEEIGAEAESDLREAFPEAHEARVLETRVYKERRATMRATPLAESLRPPARTAIEGLYLAGDWTDTGLPPTIEGAVLSGHTAAKLVQ